MHPINVARPVAGGMLARPGTYVLVLACRREALVRVGRLGELRLRPGYYLYVGSACGPGGIRARIAHHARISPHPHWHIDYLRPRTRLEMVWFRYGRRLEHAWAAALSRIRGASAPLTGFGASDCRCESHLYYFARRPEVAALTAAAARRARWSRRYRR